MKLKLSQKNGGSLALVFSFLNPLRQPLVWAVLAATLSGCFSQESRVLNNTVLTINGRSISTKEFADRLALKLKNFDALYAKDDANLDRAKEEIVRGFLLESIVTSYAKTHNIRVERNDIDNEVSSIRSKYPDDFAFRRALADQNLSLEKWRESLEISLLQKKVYSAVTAQIPAATQGELKAFYDANQPMFRQPARVQLRQIVLEKEDDAKRIYDEIIAGADMEALAKKFSIAPEASNGGNTGWLEKGTLEVFDQAFKMPIGAKSRILRSPYGWHIYQVLKKAPEGRLSFELAKDRIQTQLLEANAQRVYSAWLEEQVKKSSVTRNEAIMRSIKVTTRGS